MGNSPDNKSQFSDPRNVAVALLVLIVLIMGLLLVRNNLSDSDGEKPLRADGEERVSVVEVRFDGKENRFVDIVFNRPVGKDERGEILGRDPARISPPVNGAWLWKTPNVLRFEASYRFNMATDYKISLDAGNLLKPGQVLSGKSEFEVRTDKFKVKQATADEEPVPDVKNTVTLNGTIDFNYPVDPKVLARKMRLVDFPGGKEGSEVPIPIKLVTDYWNTSIKWKSAPVEKKADERELDLIIVGDLTPAEGNVDLGEDYIEEIPLGSKDNLSVKSVIPNSQYPVSSVGIGFSSAVSPEIALDYISVMPAVNFRVKRVQNKLVLTGDFAPGNKYQLTIAKGLPAVDDAVLGEDYSKEIQFSDLKPVVEFESPGMFLDSKGTHAVRLKSINVDKVDITVDRVFLNNLFFLFQSYGYSVWRDEYYQGTVGDYFGGRIADETDFKIDKKPNRKVSTVLDLKKYIPEEPGLYQVGVVPAGEYQGIQKWVLITDIGIVAKKGKDEFLVWTSSFANLDPVSGAVVRIISDQNQIMAKGVTDGRGLFKADGLAEEFEKQRPYMVTVERGGDFSFLLLENMEIDTSGLDVGGAVPSTGGYTAYVYGERDIYRPGETVEGVVIVRDSNLNTPAPMPVVLRQKDARGRVVKTIKETIGEDGIVSFTLPIPGFAPTGNNTLEVLAGDESIGQYLFQVEEFIPDRISVKIQTGEDNVSLGTDIVYEVRSAYLFGPPASGMSVETAIDLVARPFLPEGYKGFVFTNPERKFDSKEIFRDEGALDENGIRNFTVKFPEGALRPPSSLQAQISARVQEPGGRGVTAVRKVNVDPYPYYLGLKRKTPDEYAEPGKEVEFEYVALSPAGEKTEEVKTGELKAELYKDIWNTVLRRTSSGNYKYESSRDSVLVNSMLIDSGASGGSFTFTPPEFGSYRAVLTDPKGGASTQVQFYASGWGFSPWAVENPARIELDLEKKEYMPGETARVQVRAPFSGKLLITVEREDVYYTEIHDLDGNTATVSVPVSEKYRPNAYITATVIRGVKELEPGSAGRAFGAVPVNVDRSSNKADVQITAPEEIRPLTPLEISVKTLPGASVTVAAVDEGILQLIDQKTADPFTFFYRKLALEVLAYDTFSLLLPDVSLGLSPPGGGFAAKKEMQFLSTQGIRRVKPVAFWSGVLKADSEGKVAVKFDMPQFQGAVRIMAVAVKGEEFGSSGKFTRVKSPIVILPTVPRFFSLNESVVIPVSVRNDTKRDGIITVNIAVDGPATVNELKTGADGGEASPGAKQVKTEVQIPDGGEKTVYFEVGTTDVTGAVAVRITASGNGESSSSDTDVPVLPDLPVKRGEKIGRISADVTELTVEEGDSYLPGTLKRELYISRIPLIQFSGKLEYLLQYPYGCLEQITSRVFPLIYLSDIASEVDPGLFEKSDPAAMVQEGIRQIANMQRSGGGFSLWPGGASAEPWASIYTAHFLVEARKAGFFVQDSLYSGAIQYVREVAKAKPEYSTGELERAVYALYVLSRDGKPDTGTMDFIRARHKDELTVESRALLGGAYAASGDASALEELLAGLNDVEEVERQTGGNFNSTIRNRAILLLAILDANPDDPRAPALVERLTRDAELNSWWTTQESSFALLAIGQFIKRQQDSPPYTGTVFVGDRQVAEFGSEATLSLTDIEGGGPVKIVMGEGFQGGSAFYSLLTSGIPTRKGFKPVSDGLNVEREFLTRSGAPVDPDNIEQGDLVVVRTKIQSTAGRLQNVAIENLLPSGFEVENPRLKTTETLKWATGSSIKPGYLDIRDDRILVFTDLPDAKWYNYYALLRVVNPGTFNVPPVQAEAMYSPNIRFTGRLEEPFRVRLRE